MPIALILSIRSGVRNCAWTITTCWSRPVSSETLSASSTRALQAASPLQWTATSSPSSAASLRYLCISSILTVAAPLWPSRYGSAIHAVPPCGDPSRRIFTPLTFRCPFHSPEGNPSMSMTSARFGASTNPMTSIQKSGDSTSGLTSGTISLLIRASWAVVTPYDAKRSCASSSAL